MPDAPVVPQHTFGQILRGRTYDGLSIEEVLMPAGLRVGEHAHEQTQIYFLLEGRYVESCRTGAHVLRPGTAWFRPRAERHANAVAGDEAALTLIVTIEQARIALLQHFEASPSRLQSLLLDEVRREMLREIRHGDAASFPALEAWALLLLSRTERLLSMGERGAPEWLADAVHFIDTAWQQPISLDSVAAHVGVHRATLAAAFRRFHHASVGEAIQQRRLAHAREALLHSMRPIKEIAIESGFYDQAHFGRCFKARFGVTPAAVRTRLPQ
jgi:AraC-like DNA-binding protein/quercetin dioxygenase-like cupin family protein